jgi:hypothetical protein
VLEFCRLGHVAGEPAANGVAIKNFTLLDKRKNQFEVVAMEPG